MDLSASSIIFCSGRRLAVFLLGLLLVLPSSFVLAQSKDKTTPPSTPFRKSLASSAKKQKRPAKTKAASKKRPTPRRFRRKRSRKVPARAKAPSKKPTPRANAAPKTGISTLTRGLSLRQIYQNARNAYEYGNYKLAIQLYKSLLYPPPGRLKNRNVRKQAHKYLGLAYYFEGPLKRDNRKKARREFLRFLELSPTEDLDPALFPPNLVSLFRQVRERNRNRLQEILRRQKLRQQKKKKPLPPSEPIPLPLRQQTLTMSPILAGIPFGVSQFTNGHIVKGSLLLSLEALMLTTNIVTFAILQSFVETVGPGRGLVPVSLQPTAVALQVVQYVSLGLLGGLLVYGLVDGLIYFRRTRSTILPELPQINPGLLRSTSTSGAFKDFSFQERLP